jgi:transcription antitermination protein NusB
MRPRRRNVRELAVQILFQVEVGRLPLEEVLATAIEQMPADPKDWGYVSSADWQYIDQVAHGIAEHREELDGIIARLAEGWTLDRIANVDRIALQLALYEMLHRSVPAPVSINAAVEIVKKYSTEESGRFVNGILGAFLRERRAAAATSTPGDPADTA